MKNSWTAGLPHRRDKRLHIAHGAACTHHVFALGRIALFHSPLNRIERVDFEWHKDCAIGADAVEPFAAAQIFEIENEPVHTPEENFLHERLEAAPQRLRRPHDYVDRDDLEARKRHQPLQRAGEHQPLRVGIQD